MHADAVRTRIALSTFDGETYHYLSITTPLLGTFFAPDAIFKAFKANPLLFNLASCTHFLHGAQLSFIIKYTGCITPGKIGEELCTYVLRTGIPL